MISFCPSPTLLYPINVKGCTSCSRGIYVWMCVLVLGECVEACVFCKKFFFLQIDTMCFTCILVFVHGCLFCMCICMYVCMHACLCSYGVYKNLHLTHLLYTAVSFYFFMSFCFFLVFILSSVCFFRSLVYRFVIVVISIVVVIFTPRNMKKEFELSFAISWLFSLALFLRVCMCVNWNTLSRICLYLSWYVWV